MSLNAFFLVGFNKNTGVFPEWILLTIILLPSLSANGQLSEKHSVPCLSDEKRVGQAGDVFDKYGGLLLRQEKSVRFNARSENR